MGKNIFKSLLKTAKKRGAPETLTEGEIKEACCFMLSLPLYEVERIQRTSEASEVYRFASQMVLKEDTAFKIVMALYLEG